MHERRRCLTFLLLELICGDIFRPKKDYLFFLAFAFGRRMPNAICDLKRKGLNTS